MGNFYTDVIAKDPRFNTTRRVADLGLLEPITRAAVVAIVAEAKVQGHNLIVFETYRSRERQRELYDQGVTKLWNVGCHHFGCACDLVKLVDGEPSWDGDFGFLGKLAEKHGLIWGGNWGHPKRHNSFVDACHVQRIRVEDQGDLFSGEFYPDADYDPYGEE